MFTPPDDFDLVGSARVVGNGAVSLIQKPHHCDRRCIGVWKVLALGMSLLVCMVNLKRALSEHRTRIA